PPAGQAGVLPNRPPTPCCSVKSRGEYPTFRRLAIPERGARPPGTPPRGGSGYPTCVPRRNGILRCQGRPRAKSRSMEVWHGGSRVRFGGGRLGQRGGGVVA